MLSSPIGLQHTDTVAAAGLVSTIESVSTAAAFVFTTVLKLPNVLGNVSDSAKTLAEFLKPVMAYGIGEVLE